MCGIVLLSIPLLIALYAFIPENLEDIIKEKEIQDSEFAQDTSNLEVENLGTDIVRTIWWQGLCFGVVRAFSVSSVEAATALILEHEFQWRLGAIGLAVGFSFMCGLPFSCAARLLQKIFRVTDSKIMLGSALLALCATLFFIPAVSSMIAVVAHGSNIEVLILIFADCLIFPAFYFASGMLDGFAIRCSRDDTPYSLNNYQMLDTMVQNTIAQSILPPIARSVIFYCGRGSYALLQASVSMCGCASCCHVVQLLKHKAKAISKSYHRTDRNGQT